MLSRFSPAQSRLLSSDVYFRLGNDVQILEVFLGFHLAHRPLVRAPLGLAEFQERLVAGTVGNRHSTLAWCDEFAVAVVLAGPLFISSRMRLAPL
jgi:hypothetical protein